MKLKPNTSDGHVLENQDIQCYFKEEGSRYDRYMTNDISNCFIHKIFQ